MLTQVDGMGMTNDWGLVEGQLDTYLFEKIELIRGANGLLTGVGNASGTINFVRKRPTNKDGGEIQLTDSMAQLIGRQPFHGLRYEGTRYDCGDKIGFLEANVALSRAHPEMGAKAREAVLRVMK